MLPTRTLLLAAPLLAAPACNWVGPKVWVEDQQVLEVPASGVEAVECRTDNGAIHAIAADGPKIVVNVKRRGGGLDQQHAEAALEAILLHAKVEGDRVHIGWKWATPKEEGWGSKVSFQIQMPGSLPLKAVTDNGNITVDQVLAAIDAESDNGRIEIDGGKGQIVALTDNGSITVKNCSGEVSATSDNGAIGVSGAVTAFHAKTDNGGIALRLTDPQGGFTGGEAISDNGGVHLDIGSGHNLELDAATDNGRIDLKLESLSISGGKRSMTAKLGKGEPAGTMRIRTDNGSITIK